MVVKNKTPAKCGRGNNEHRHIWTGGIFLELIQD